MEKNEFFHVPVLRSTKGNEALRKGISPTETGLLQHFISLKARAFKLPAISTLLSGAIDLLMEYYWLGNI